MGGSFSIRLVLLVIALVLLVSGSFLVFLGISSMLQRRLSTKPETERRDKTGDDHRHAA